MSEVSFFAFHTVYLRCRDDFRDVCTENFNYDSQSAFQLTQNRPKGRFCSMWRWGESSQEYFSRRRSRNFTTLARHRAVLSAICLRPFNSTRKRSSSLPAPTTKRPRSQRGLFDCMWRCGELNPGPKKSYLCVSTMRRTSCGFKLHEYEMHRIAYNRALFLDTDERLHQYPNLMTSISTPIGFRG